MEIEDDNVDLKHVSSSKRKEGSNEIRKGNTNDECISLSTSKHASKKVKREYDDDLVDNIPKGTQSITSHPVSITSSEKSHRSQMVLDPFLSLSKRSKMKDGYQWLIC